MTWNYNEACSCSRQPGMLNNGVSTCVAGMSAESGPLCHISGLLVWSVQYESIFHFISWNYDQSWRPVNSIGAAESLAAGDAINVGKILAKDFAKIHCNTIYLGMAIDSKHLYTIFTIQRQSIDRSTCRNVGVIRFKFKTNAISQFVWIPDKLNLADSIIKCNSPYVPAVNRMLHSYSL